MAKREIEEKDTEKKYLTYEEVDRERKRIAKERLNTFLRIVGLFSTVLLITAGLFDILFEMSYFGKLGNMISGSYEHDRIWEIIGNELTKTLEDGSVVNVGKIFDNVIFGIWFPKIVITLIFAAGVVGVIYLVTFSLVDFVEFIQNAIGITKQGVKDNINNLKDALPDVKFFGKKEAEPVEETPVKKTRRRKKSADTNEYGYTDEELDALLRGEKIEAQKEMARLDNATKPLFDSESK